MADEKKNQQNNPSDKSENKKGQQPGQFEKGSQQSREAGRKGGGQSNSTNR